MGANFFVAFDGDCSRREGDGSPLPESLDLDEAARALGVHYQTAYRWVRTGVLPAVKIGCGYRLTAEDVERFLEVRRSGQAVSYTGRNRDWAGLIERFYSAAVAGDETAARRVFERLHLARVPVVDQCEQLVAPFARRLQMDFLGGCVLPGQVRLAAAICERQLHWATRLVWERCHQPAALVLTPPGEAHRLPRVMASSVLRSEQWAVVDLDGGTGLRELAAFADRMAATLVVICPTVTDDRAKELAAELERVLAVPILVGGAGASLQELSDAASVVREMYPEVRTRRAASASVARHAGR